MAEKINLRKKLNLLFDLDSWKNQTVASELIKASVNLIEIIGSPLNGMSVSIFDNEVPGHNVSIDNLIEGSLEGRLLSDYQLRDAVGQLFVEDYKAGKDSELNAYNVFITSKCLARGYTGGAANFQISTSANDLIAEIPISVVSTFYADKLAQLSEMDRTLSFGNGEGLIVDPEDMAATVLYHELGHNMGATDSKYHDDLVSALGNHCIKDSCVMSQSSNPMEGWLNKTKQRLFREETGKSPYCSDCESAMVQKQYKIHG